MNVYTDYGDNFTLRRYTPIPDEPPSYLSMPEWHQRAACQGSNPDIFFPQKNRVALQARAICAICPVIVDCRETALALPPTEDYGMWGGMSRRERLAERRRRKREAAA